MNLFRCVVAFATLGCLTAMGLAQLPDDIRIEQDRCIQELSDAYPGIHFYREGARVSRTYGVPFGAGATAVQSADAFVASYSGLFANGEGVFQRTGTQSVLDNKFTAVYYDQYMGTVPVDHGWVTVLVKNTANNPIVLVNNSTKMTREVGTTPFYTQAQAIQSVRAWNPRLRSFTKPSLTIHVGEHEESSNLGWKVIADSQSSYMPERFEIIVDALTNQIISVESKVYEVDVTGSVAGYATPGLKPNQANNPVALRSLAGLRVNITGGNFAYTDASGNYTIVHGGASAVTVNADLRGQFVNVQNSAGAEHTLSTGVTPPGPANFVFNSPSDDSKTAQVNGFIHTNIVHDFAKSINNAYPGIDIAIPCNVGVTGTCNAYYTANTINFFPPGGGCPNTCYSTVVYHEYGHFIIDKGHPTAAGDYHEGMADVTSAFCADNAWLGEDFRGQGTGPLRNCINTQVYPCSGNSHTCGQVISGAFWETLLELDTTVGHATGLSLAKGWYLNSILIRPAGITPAVTIDVLTLDDDDANINNGTPHYQEIATGFGNKNLDAPEIDFVFIAPITAPSGLIVRDKSADYFQDYRWFEMTVTNAAGIVDPSSVKVKMSVERGSYTAYSLNALGSNRYGAWLPIPICGHGAKYYVEANDTVNRINTYPSNAPASTINLVHADSTTVTFTDTFNTALGWTVSNDGSLTSGAWVRADPNGTTLNGFQANPENDSNDAGTVCMFTGQGSVGGAAGNADVDGGPTRIVSPTFDLTNSNAIIEYRRWFFNDDGDDSFVVEVSNNNGATWEQVDGIYYTGVENSWVQHSFVVSNYVLPTNQVKVRFITADNPNNSITEAAIDNVIVRKVVCDY